MLNKKNITMLSTFLLGVFLFSPTSIAIDYSITKQSTFKEFSNKYKAFCNSWTGASWSFSVFYPPYSNGSNDYVELTSNYSKLGRLGGAANLVHTVMNKKMGDNEGGYWNIGISRETGELHLNVQMGMGTSFAVISGGKIVNMASLTSKPEHLQRMNLRQSRQGMEKVNSCPFSENDSRTIYDNYLKYGE